MGSVTDIRRLFQETINHFGQLDILVNNAGVAAGAVIAEVTEEDYEKVFDINVRSVLFALQEAARRMNNGGRVVNISSTTTMFPSPGMAVYAASKAAVKLLTQVLAREVGDRGITVNTVIPGPSEYRLEENINEIQQPKICRLVTRSKGKVSEPPKPHELIVGGALVGLAMVICTPPSPSGTA